MDEHGFLLFPPLALSHSPLGRPTVVLPLFRQESSRPPRAEERRRTATLGKLRRPRIASITP